MHDPAFSVGLSNARRDAPAHPRGQWFGPFTWKTWVMDWIGYPGGTAEIAVEGTTLPAHPRLSHTWYVYAPGVSYRHRTDADAELRGDALWCFFDFRHPWSPLASRPLTVLLDPEERIGPHVHAMFDLAQHQEPGSDLIIRGHALSIFGEILAASMRGHAGSPDDPWPVRAPGSDRTHNHALLLKVDQEVMRHLSRPPSISELAERLHMSPSSLAHSFKAETGTTVMERVRWVRIREARRLLALPDATAKSVARTLGFSSPFHLSKVFTEISGITPSDFMRQQRR
ncbi:MAG: helix-turn-helix transcriptional regulator [Planctomycetes bacterium]|nr:helix-turn-helix transcriptional regulator [Planctomycetota bacterium]